MSVIKCEQRGCAHNSDCKCAKKRVDVCTGGRDCKTVFCASYRPRRRIDAGELANEIGSLELPCRDNCICCDAAGCAHNKDGACMAERVNISRADMTPKGKCLCRSFERDFKS